MIFFKKEKNQYLKNINFDLNDLNDLNDPNTFIINFSNCKTCSGFSKQLFEKFPYAIKRKNEIYEPGKIYIRKNIINAMTQLSDDIESEFDINNITYFRSCLEEIEKAFGNNNKIITLIFHYNLGCKNTQKNSNFDFRYLILSVFEMKNINNFKCFLVLE